MDVYALLYDDGQGAVTQWKVSSWAPPEKAEYDIRVMAQRPQILPNIAIALVENGMRCARECLLRKYPIFRSKAGGPLLFTVDLAGITTPVQPPASLALSAALAFLADLAGSLPELPRAVAATGAVDLKERRVTRVNHINEKIEAALHAKNASGAYLLGAGDLILYPEENDAEIDSRLRTQAQARGVILTPVRYVDEALRLILGEKGTAWERLRKLPRWHWRKAAASFAAALFLYFLLGYPWPLRGPAVTVTAPAAQSQASWQDPGVKRWLEEPAVLQGKDACYLVEGRIEAPGFLRLFKDLRLRVTVATAGGKYPQPETTLTRWSGRFRARIWLDRRLPDANLRLELCQGEKLLAVREITFRDGPPAPQWSLAVKNNVLEVGYRSGDGFPQVAALHTDSGALRLTYLPDGGWGASLYPFAWWEGGRFIRGGRALETDGQLLFRAVADNADPQSLKLRVVLEAADWEITLRPPEDGTTRAACRVRLLRLPAVDARPVPGEAFQMVHLGSMYFDAKHWDTCTAVAWEPTRAPLKIKGREVKVPVERTPAECRVPLTNPRNGRLIFTSPLEAGSLALKGGNSVWKKNAPTFVVELEDPPRALVNGWLSPAQNPHQENVALWAGLKEPLSSWRYKVEVQRAIQTEQGNSPPPDRHVGWR